MAVNDGGYKHGGFWRISDRSGRKLRNYDTRQEWTGAIVGNDEFEERHPQDFVRGLADKQIVPKPRPPPPTETFVGALQTDLTVAALAGQTSITVTSSVRMGTGDRIGLSTDVGKWFIATITSVPSTTTINFTPALPGAVSVGRIVTDYSAVALASVG